MNMQHILLFTKYLKQYALDISGKKYNEESDNINDYIFINNTLKIFFKIVNDLNFRRISLKTKFYIFEFNNDVKQNSTL